MFQICKKNSRSGYTLMEVLAVVAIIAIIALIAVPSFMSSRKSMVFTQRNDYARSIYIAAQTHLTDLRSKGGLGSLPKNEAATKAQKDGTNPTAYSNANKNGYVYTHSEETAIYNAILPVNSVDATIRDQQVIIEYNPINGSVYSVFYYEGDESISSLYSQGKLNREESARKEMLLGYYDGSDLSPIELDIYRVKSEISYENGEEGIVTLQFPVQIKDESGTNVNIFDENEGSESYFKNRLEIALTVTGESNNGSFTKTITAKTNNDIKITPISIVGAVPALQITFPLDSFGKDSLNQNQGFTDLANASGNQNVLIGDNITLTADLAFIPDSNDPIILFESASIAGINPLFHSLTQNPRYNPEKTGKDDERKYILAISNGRNLQNLNNLDPTLLSQVDSIVFTRQGPAVPAEEGTEFILDWEDTTSNYYKAKYSATFPDGLSFQPVNLSGKADSKALEIIGNGITIQKLNIDNSSENMGLFGDLRYASVERITVKGFTIGGGNVTQNDKFHAGALVGYTSNVVVKHCYSSEINILPSGSRYAYEGIGGLIGYAANTSVQSCSVEDISFASLPATEDSNTYTYTYTENLGGTVGYASGASFKGVYVSLTNTPKYADDAGGFAGYVTGTRVDGLKLKMAADSVDADANVARLGGAIGQSLDMTMENVYIKLPDGIALRAIGNAAGAIAKVQGGTLADIHVIAEGACYITADLAAGFATVSNGVISNCSVLPPQGNTSDNRTYDSSKISITGINAAGFVVTNESRISDSYGLAKVTAANPEDKKLAPAAAGFVLNNNGTIEKCFSNASAENGSAFVHNNIGTVQNCYGWATANATLPSQTNDTTNKYKSSYFVLRDTDSSSTDPFVALFDHAGRKSDTFVNTDALLDPLALEALNDPSSTTPIWKQIGENPNDQYPYPYLENLHPKGEWDAPRGGNYAYGVLYYEQYTDNSWGLNVTQLSETRLDFNNDLKGKDADTSIYGYALYCRTGKQSDLGISGAAIGTDGWTHEAALIEKLNLSSLYSIYSLTANSTNGTATIGGRIFNLFYAPGNESSSYAIRQAGQFQNISKNAGQTFQITRSLNLGNNTLSTFSGTLTCSDGVKITTSAPLVNTLTGSLDGLDVTGTIIDASGNVGILAGTMNSGTIKNCTVHGSISGSADNIGGVAGMVKTGSISETSSDVTVPPDAHPFANFESVTFRDANYYSKSDTAYGNGLNSISSVSLTSTESGIPEVYHADVSNCSYQSENSTFHSSCATYQFYQVEKYSTFKKGTQIVGFETASPTYEDLGATPDSTDWKQTNYFQQKSDDGTTKYLPVYVRCKKTTVESDDSTDTTTATTVPTEAEESISAVAEETATYTFEFTTNTSETNLENTEDVTDLSSPVSVDLYQISGEIPTSGTYLLSYGDEVFYCSDKGTNWEASGKITPFTRFIWEATSGKWKNLDADTQITVSLNTSGGSSAAKIDESNQGECDVYSVTVYHHLTHEGSARSITWGGNS